MDHSAAKPVRATLGSALGVAAAGSLVTGLAFALSIGSLNGWSVGRDVAVLAAHLTALYFCLYAIGLGAAALVALIAGRRPRARVFVGLLAGFAVFLNGLSRFSPATQLFARVPSLNAIGAFDLLAIAVCSAAVAVAISATARRTRWAAAGFAIVLAIGTLSLNRAHERPLRRDLRAAVPPLLAGTDRDAEVAAERLDSARLVVLGFDGLTWEIVLPLLREGELPHLRAFLRGAAYGYLDTLDYAISPVIWETMSTGVRPDRHGIGDHGHFDFAGVRRRIAFLPSLDLCDAPMGLRRLLVATDPIAPWDNVKVTALDARAARLWEIASKHGIPVGVYDWLNSGPAAAVEGFVHGNGYVEPVDHPPDLEASFAPLPPREKMDPRTRAAGDPVGDYERALWSRFVALSLRHRPELLMYYTHYGDGVNHLNWKAETVGSSLFYSGLSHPDVVPGPLIRAATRLFDEIVGDVMRRVPEQATVVIVSDHGFDFRGYEHENGPAGVWMLRGPGIAQGPFDGATVYDVAPTLLHLLGLPPAEEMPGTVLSAVAGDRAERVASYGDPIPVKAHHVDKDALARDVEYLRSLGYVID